MKCVIVFAALVLIGCKPTKSDLPDATCVAATGVKIEVAKQNVYTPLPESLTADVVDPSPVESSTYGMAVNDANRRSVLLNQCRSQLEAVRELQGTKASK